MNIKNIRKFTALQAILPLLLFLASVAAEASPPLQKVSVAQWGKEKFLLYLPFYVAMEEGYFAKRGIEIDLLFAGNDDQVFATVMSGDATFGMSDPVFVAISRERGGPGKVVALVATKLGLFGYTNKPHLPMMDKPEFAKGLRIGSQPSPSTTYTLLSAFLKKNQLEQSGTRLVEAAIGGQMALLESGGADVVLDFEPAVALAESKGYRVNFAFDGYTEPQAVTGITTLESTIRDDPQLVQKMVSAIQDGLTALQRNREVAFRVARKLFPGLSDTVSQNAVKRMLEVRTFPVSAEVDENYWQRTLRARLDSGELKAPQATTVSVDNRFAGRARQEIGSE